MARSFELGTIEETLFIKGIDKLSIEAIDSLYLHLTDFCVDEKGIVRKSQGLVAGLENEDDQNYVPSSRYEIKMKPWNSHGEYVVIELPNPVNDCEKWRFIRTAFINELDKRLNSDLRKLK